MTFSPKRRVYEVGGACLVDADHDAPAPRATVRVRRAWRLVLSTLAGALFLEAVFAGAMLSGAIWARPAHIVTATALLGSTAAAGIVAAVVLRRVAGGTKLALALLSLAVMLLLQTAVGKLAAGGANLLWLHIPLGVALVAFAAHLVAAARRLGKT